MPSDGYSAKYGCHVGLEGGGPICAMFAIAPYCGPGSNETGGALIGDLNGLCSTQPFLDQTSLALFNWIFSVVT